VSTPAHAGGLPPLPDPVRGPRAWLDTARAVAVAVLLLGSLLLLNLWQVATLVARPFSARAFRHANRAAADLWWGWCVRVAQGLYGTHVVQTGAALPPREDAIVLANHQQMADITFLMFPARAAGRLGDMKWMLKRVIRWVPGVGWGLAFLDNVFLARDWAADAHRIARTFQNLIRHRVPCWMLSFPEGTRGTAAKLAASRAYQQAQGLQPLAHVLLPRTKGFVATVQGLRGHVTAVYDVTIGYVGGVPTLWQYIKGYARVAHLHVRRYPVADLPTDETALAAWLHARWQEKDALLARFYREGRFPAALAPAGEEGR